MSSFLGIIILLSSVQGFLSHLQKQKYGCDSRSIASKCQKYGKKKKKNNSKRLTFIVICPGLFWMLCGEARIFHDINSGFSIHI